MLGVLFFAIFLGVGLYFAREFAFGQNKFSPINLMLFVWAVSVGIAHLGLSPYEKQWTLEFYFLLLLFFCLFFGVGKFLENKWLKTEVLENIIPPHSSKSTLIILGLLTILTASANAYMYIRYGTFPLFSSVPDKLRFIINKEVFGLWEYAALLPRLYIPLTFIYLLFLNKDQKWSKIFGWANVVLGFMFLSLYSSRLVLALPIILSYFCYLYIKKNTISKKRIIASAFVVVLLLLAISVAIPALRQYITYKDYYSNVEYTPFTYLIDLVDADVPKGLEWVVGLYLIPSFNLQAMMRAVDFYGFNNYYWGAYELSVFAPAFQIFSIPWFNVVIPWKEIFLPWWVTATFLFSYFADFGWLGIVGAGALWGLGLSWLYSLMSKKPTLLSVMLLSYFSFIVIMSIYTNYLMREEFYLDVAFILVFGYLAKKIAK